VAALSLLTLALPARAGVVTFDSASDVVLGPTEAPGVWYHDRYPPSGFVAGQTGGGRAGVLRESISSADQNGSRPFGYNIGFYDYQGRKIDLPPGSVFVSVDLYVPSSWAGLTQQDPNGNPASWGTLASLWTTGADKSGNTDDVYPIIGFNNTTTSDGSSGSGTGGFRVYDQTSGWTNVGGFSNGYDTWYNLGIELTSSDQLSYFVNGQLVYTDTTVTKTTSFSNVMLQGYNGGNSYDIFWDNLDGPATAPEPGSLVLCGIGIAGLCGYAWRRKKTAVAAG
jgi:hypothetical protein